MAPINIPEGYVFIPRRRGENVAADLFESVERVGADRYTSVRTTTNGYHVEQAVADDYQAQFEADPEETEEDESTGGDGGQESGTGDTGGQESTGTGDTGTPVKDEEEETATVTEANTRDEINDFAAKLDPAVDTTKAANKADAIKMIEEALAQKSDQTAE